jgi:sigma-B regulation protein RsbU (phosphoserine phosphatase)
VTEDGLAAWEVLQSAQAPSLVILDWNMPGLEGTEICRRVRELPGETSTYIIFVTAKDYRDDIVAGLNAGADDYLTKPFDRDELRARLQVGVRMLGLQNALSARLHEIEETLTRVQDSFLSGQLPHRVEGVQVAARTIPSTQVDGDFYDFHQHTRECFDVVVGDVMGKGMKAALFGAATVTRFLRSLQELMAESSELYDHPEPASIVNRVRVRMSHQLSSLESFVTSCYARFDLRRQVFTYVDCGHTKTIHYRAGTGHCDQLAGPNTPLGFSDDEQYVQQSVNFRKGDIFVLYSDGITEARAPDQEFFGERQLIRTVQEAAGQSSSAILDAVFKRLTEFCGSDRFRDDATCVIVKISEASDAPSARSASFEISSEFEALLDLRRSLWDFLHRSAGSRVIEADMHDIELAVQEAAANIIEHGYGGEPGKRVVVEVEHTRFRVQIRLKYWGNEFDRSDVPPPAFDGSREGGFGLYIVEHLMTEVEYGVARDGTHLVTLTKLLSA